MNNFVTVEVPPIGKTRARNIWLNPVPHEGAIKLFSDGPQLRPEKIKELIDVLIKAYESFIGWRCPDCSGENFTLSQINYRYKWVRCQHCKKKTLREELGLV